MREPNAYQDYVVTRLHYERQQNTLDNIACELGVVAYRPDYHGKRGDKNTVLFYTTEAHIHNKKVDRLVARMGCRAYSRAEAADRPYDISDDQVYADHFFAFENTDVNGMLSYDFANHGTLDLRLNEREVLRGAISAALDRYLMAATKDVPAEDTGPRMYLVLLANNIDINIEAKPAATADEARDLLVSAFLEDLDGRDITLGENGFPPLPDGVFEYECVHDGCELSLSEDGFSVYGDGDLCYGKLISLPGTYTPAIQDAIQYFVYEDTVRSSSSVQHIFHCPASLLATHFGIDVDAARQELADEENLCANAKLKCGVVTVTVEDGYISADIAVVFEDFEEWHTAGGMSLGSWENTDKAPEWVNGLIRAVECYCEG